MATRNAEAYEAANKKYEWGFSSDIEQEFAPKGLTEEQRWERLGLTKDGKPVDPKKFE